MNLTHFMFLSHGIICVTPYHCVNTLYHFCVIVFSILYILYIFLRTKFYFVDSIFATAWPIPSQICLFELDPLHVWVLLWLLFCILYEKNSFVSLIICLVNGLESQTANLLKSILSVCLNLTHFMYMYHTCGATCLSCKYTHFVLCTV